MSFLAATSSTSIWPVPVSTSAGVRIWTSMFTSLTSKGMYCSASHWIDSSSSSCVIFGIEIFLMITEWPLTPMATSRFFSLYWLTSCRMASTMAVEFISAPSTITSGASGDTPKASRIYPRFASFSCTSFTELEPMSRPRASLPFAMFRVPRRCRRRYHRNFYCPKKRPLPPLRGPAGAVSGKELGALVQGKAERKEDLALGLHPAVVAGLDAVDGRFRDARLARQLGLGHQRCLAELLYSVHDAPEGGHEAALRASIMSPTCSLHRSIRFM